MRGERLVSRELPPAIMAQPLAARAVALCEGCPVANLCATKEPRDCAVAAEERMDYAQSSPELSQPPVSYRKDLFDDRKKKVMAQPRVATPQPVPPRPDIRLQTPAQTPVSPPRRQVKFPRAVGHKQPVGESGAQKVAAILAGLVKVEPSKSAHAKK